MYDMEIKRKFQSVINVKKSKISVKVIKLNASECISLKNNIANQ